MESFAREKEYQLRDLQEPENRMKTHEAWPWTRLSAKKLSWVSNGNICPSQYTQGSPTSHHPCLLLSAYNVCFCQPLHCVLDVYGRQVNRHSTMISSSSITGSFMVEMTVIKDIFNLGEIGIMYSNKKNHNFLIVAIVTTNRS